MSKERLNKLTRECQERARFFKFITYCQAAGLGSIDAEEDRAYLPEQKQFFAQYEQQLMTDTHLASVLAEVVLEEA